MKIKQIMKYCICKSPVLSEPDTDSTEIISSECAEKGKYLRNDGFGKPGGPRLFSTSCWCAPNKNFLRSCLRAWGGPNSGGFCREGWFSPFFLVIIFLIRKVTGRSKPGFPASHLLVVPVWYIDCRKLEFAASERSRKKGDQPKLINCGWEGREQL